MRLKKEELIEKLKDFQKSCVSCKSITSLLNYYINSVENGERGFEYFDGNYIPDYRSVYEGRQLHVFDSTIIKNGNGESYEFSFYDNKISIHNRNLDNETKLFIEKYLDGTFHLSEESIRYENGYSSKQVESIDNRCVFKSDGILLEQECDKFYKDGKSTYHTKVFGDSVIATWNTKDQFKKSSTYLVNDEDFVKSFKEARRDRLDYDSEYVMALGDLILDKYVNSEEMDLLAEDYHLTDMVDSINKTR